MIGGGERALALRVAAAVGPSARVTSMRAAEQIVAWLDAGDRLGAVVTWSWLGSEGGLAVAGILARRDPGAPLLVLAEHPVGEHHLEAFRMEATYLTRAPFPAEVLGDVLHFFERSMRARDRRRAAALHLLERHRLKGRAADLLMLVADGVERKALGDALGISTNSVKAPLRILLHETRTHTVEGLLRRIDEVADTLFRPPPPPVRGSKASGVVRVRLTEDEAGDTPQWG